MDFGGGTPIERRRVLTAGCFGLAFVASGTILRQPLRSAFAAVVRPQSASPNLEVQMLQTAASLENLSIATYAATLDLPFVQRNAAIAQFLETTLQQHSEHVARFNAEAEQLGGVRQEASNRQYARFVETTLPALVDAAGAVGLAATLEEVATDTYLNNLAGLSDPALRTLMASVMAVECQHLATLRALGAVIAAGSHDLVAFPTDLHALPAAVGSVAFPLAMEVPNFATSPADGAVQMTARGFSQAILPPGTPTVTPPTVPTVLPTVTVPTVTVTTVTVPTVTVPTLPPTPLPPTTTTTMPTTSTVPSPTASSAPTLPPASTAPTAPTAPSVPAAPGAGSTSPSGPSSPPSPTAAASPPPTATTTSVAPTSTNPPQECPTTTTTTSTTSTTEPESSLGPPETPVPDSPPEDARESCEPAPTIEEFATPLLREIVDDELATVEVLASVEVLAVNAYAVARRAAAEGRLGAVPPALAQYLDTVHNHHQVALELWNRALAHRERPLVTLAPTELATPINETLRTTDAIVVAEVALRLEEIVAATYLQAVAQLVSEGAILFAGSILSVDRQHISVLLFTLGRVPAPESFATAALAYASDGS